MSSGAAARRSIHVLSLFSPLSSLIVFSAKIAAEVTSCRLCSEFVLGSIVAAILPADREEETGASSAENGRVVITRDSRMETEENSEANGGTVVPPPTEVTLIDGVDSVLIDALQNASKRERNLTFKLEDNIVKFISPSVKEKKLVFPPLPPHHRLILHRLADRFNLSHVVRDEKNTHRHNKSDTCTKRSGRGKNKQMILYKRDDTKLPDFLLIDKFGKKSKKTKKKIILRRKENAALCEKDGEGLLPAG